MSKWILACVCRAAVQLSSAICTSTSLGGEAPCLAMPPAATKRKDKGAEGQAWGTPAVLERLTPYFAQLTPTYADHLAAGGDSR